MSIYLIAYSLSHIIDFNGYAANGAYQLMNPLNRLADGQVIGRDFQFFHGPGVVLIYYPIYFISKGQLFASETSRYITSILIFFISTFIYSLAWFFKEKYSYAKAAVSLALIALITYFTADVITPSNSLIGTRTALPLFIAVLILYKPKNVYRLWKFNIRLFDILFGLAVALSISFGTEQGIAALVAGVIVEIINTLSKNKKSLLSKLLFLIINVFTMLLMTLLFLVIVFNAMTLGHATTALRYVLIEVPGDQFWYFGGYPQGFLTWGNIIPNLTRPYLLLVYALVLASSLLIYLLFRKGMLSKNQTLSSVFLLIYGMVSFGSMISYFAPAQAIPLSRTASLLLGLLATMILFKFINSGKYKNIKNIVVIFCFIISIAFSINFLYNTNKIHPRYYMTAYNTCYHSDNPDTCMLGSSWKNNLKIFQPYLNKVSESGSFLWSTYSSIYETIYNTKMPSNQGHDYIIHALGPDRRNRYAHDFINSNPLFSITLRQSYFIYEEWLWARHWDYYLNLLENYKIVSSNKFHHLWEQSIPINNSTYKKSLQYTDSIIFLPENTSENKEIIEVTVDYSAESFWSNKPFLKKLPRYILRPVNSHSTIGISLPPYENTWTFPVVLNEKSQNSVLVYSAEGILPGAKLKIQNVQYRVINTNPENLKEFTETYLPTN
jgi:hypothetical protein